MGTAHSVFRYQKLAYGWLDLVYLLCFYITEHGSMGAWQSHELMSERHAFCLFSTRALGNQRPRNREVD